MGKNIILCAIKCGIPWLLWVSPPAALAQIHILDVDGCEQYQLTKSIETAESTRLIATFDPGKRIIAIDYDRLKVSVSKNDEGAKTYSITTIIRLHDGLHCVFKDEENGICYELIYFYLYAPPSHPVLQISWNNRSKPDTEYLLYTENVKLY